jgi:hypothetical protein
MKIYVVLLIILFPICYIAASDHHIKTDDSAILIYVIEPLCGDDNFDNSITQQDKDDNNSLTVFFVLNKSCCVFCLPSESNNFISEFDFPTNPPPP